MFINNFLSSKKIFIDKIKLLIYNRDMKKLGLSLLIICVSIVNSYATKNIFILHSYRPSLGWTEQMHKGFTDVINQHNESLLIVQESLDIKSSYNALKQEDIYNYLNLKYKDFIPDVFFCSDNEALDFILKFRESDRNSQLFTNNIPIVACGINLQDKNDYQNLQNLFIIQEEMSLNETIVLAKQLHKNSRDFIFLTDKSDYGLYLEQAIINYFQDFNTDINYKIISIEYIYDLDNIFHKEIKNSSVIFLLCGQLKINETTLYDITKIPELVLSRTDLPIYTFWKDYLFPGIMGGKVIYPYNQGLKAANITKGILFKKHQHTQTHIFDSPNEYFFDYSAIHKFKINKKLLPKQSKIINIPEKTKEYNRIIKYLISLIIFISAVTIILIIENFSRKKIQKELHQSKLLFDFISEHTDEIIWLMNQDKKFFFLTPVAEKKLGYKLQELENIKFEELLEEYPNTFYNNYMEAVNNLLNPQKSKDVSLKHNTKQEEILRFELPIKTKNNELLWGDITIKLLPGEGKNSFWVLGAIHDVTNIKKVQNELLQTLNERELLLKEVHHRVKNNLQIISTLVQLQLDKFNDKDWYETLHNIQSRIHAISYIHQKIYTSNHFSFIRFDEYVKEISHKLCSLYTNKYIQFSFETEEISIPLELCVSLAMVYHELFTNAVKYSDSNNKNLDFTIKLFKEILKQTTQSTSDKRFNLNDTSSEVIHLFFKDSGKGFPQDFTLSKVKTVGLSLINNLISNLNGSINIYNDNGAVIQISIPLKGVQNA